jgi:hypothetical protein
MQFYTGGFLGGGATPDAKDGADYPRFAGLCIETQVCSTNVAINMVWQHAMCILLYCQGHCDYPRFAGLCIKTQVCSTNGASQWLYSMSAFGGLLILPRAVLITLALQDCALRHKCV